MAPAEDQERRRLIRELYQAVSSRLKTNVGVRRQPLDIARTGARMNETTRNAPFRRTSKSKWV